VELDKNWQQAENDMLLKRMHWVYCSRKSAAEVTTISSLSAISTRKLVYAFVITLLLNI